MKLVRWLQLEKKGVLCQGVEIMKECFTNFELLSNGLIVWTRQIGGLAYLNLELPWGACSVE